MGSKKITSIDLSNSPENEKPKTRRIKKSTKVKPTTISKLDWQTLYADLGTRTANALRDARVKPEKLAKMSDGEITALEGIADKGLEEIRTKYPINISKKVAKKEIVEELEEEGPLPPNKRHLHRNSKRFQATTKLVDKTTLYTPSDAVDLVIKSNIAKFNATITAHFVLKEKLSRIEVEFPFKAGKPKVVKIATDALLKKISDGDIDFDILVTIPEMMPKLAKYAKILGPRGLMPSPKTNTITDKPENKKKELEAGKTFIKAENKAPLMHVVIGKIEQKPKELLANLEALIKVIQPRKISKIVLASSMSPGIKVLIEK